MCFVIYFCLIVLIAGMVYGLSPWRQHQMMGMETYEQLTNTICLWSPTTPVHCCYNHPLIYHSIPLDREAIFFEYVVIHGKRYYASRSVGTCLLSLVQVAIPSDLGGSGTTVAYGEILEVFQFKQDIYRVNESMWFAWMQWFKQWTGEREGIWETL